MPSNLPLLILEAITAYFIESGPVFDKTSDNLRHELSFQNDSHYEEYPDIADEEVTLLQLLLASTKRLVSSEESAIHTHIHHLIEEAFIEQEMLSSIQELWPQTHSNDVTLAHLALIEKEVSNHLSQHGTTLFQEFSARARQQAEKQDSSSLSR